MNEIYVLNGLKTPPNMAGTADFGQSHYLDPLARRAKVLTPATCDAVLINPLNVERTPSFAGLVAGRLGPQQYATVPEYRPICRFAPLLRSLPWAVRRPAARVHQFKSG
ncbi:MAG: hypothetical protein HY718_14765 [Planctomycetes bacterium]|nr:hypothetical protein [Planctomycetota bacterium]